MPELRSVVKHKCPRPSLPRLAETSSGLSQAPRAVLCSLKDGDRAHRYVAAAKCGLSERSSSSVVGHGFCAVKRLSMASRKAV